MNILLMEYAINGKFLGFKYLDNNDVLICRHIRQPFRFGAKILLTCQVSLKHYAARMTNNFYDFYLLFETKDGKKKMYALPLVNEDIQQTGVYVNRLPEAEMARWVLSRRLYFFDNTSMLQENVNTSNIIYRICDKLEMEVQLQVKLTANIFIKSFHKRKKKSRKKERKSNDSDRQIWNKKYLYNGTLKIER